MTLDQGRDIAVLRPGQQIAFPMARHRPIFNRCRPLTDRDDVLDLPPSITDETRLFRSTDRALRPKTLGSHHSRHSGDALRSEGSPSLVIEVRTSDGPVFEAAFQWSLEPER